MSTLAIAMWQVHQATPFVLAELSALAGQGAALDTATVMLLAALALLVVAIFILRLAVRVFIAALRAIFDDSGPTVRFYLFVILVVVVLLVVQRMSH